MSVIERGQRRWGRAAVLGLLLAAAAVTAWTQPPLFAAFAGGALLAWLLMRLAHPAARPPGPCPAAREARPEDARAWQDTVPGWE